MRERVSRFMSGERAWGLLEVHDEWKARMEEARAQREAEWT